MTLLVRRTRQHSASGTNEKALTPVLLSRAECAARRGHTASGASTAREIHERIVPCTFIDKRVPAVQTWVRRASFTA